MKSVSFVAGILSAIALAALPAFGQAAKGLNKCQTTMGKESAKYIRTVADTLGKCLGKMSSEVIVNGASTAVAATTNAATCVSALRKIVNTSDTTKQLADKFNAKVAKACDPSINPGLLFSEADTYTVGATKLSAANLNAYCESFGGDGAIGDFDEWRDCLRTATDCEARQAVAVQWPRALEYFAALAPAITALPPSPERSDALTALSALDTAMEGASDDNLPELGCGPASGPTAKLLVTGLTQCDQGAGTLGVCPGMPAGQDASVGAGVAFSYTDNGDGTITDNATGLMWEKLSDDGSIHDQDTAYTWYTAATGKIASLNAGGGFAGHTDWRIPNLREIESLRDLGRTNPAMDPIFKTGCVFGCTVLTCSCTRADYYWSSTTFQGAPSRAWGIYPNDGDIGPYNKVNSLYVRAVRGGL